MKAKIPVLIVAGLFLATISKAQNCGGWQNNRVVVQGRIVFPERAVVAYNYQAPVYERYENRRDRRMDEYDQYCREHREYRGNRETFYRIHYAYPVGCRPVRYEERRRW